MVLGLISVTHLFREKRRNKTCRWKVARDKVPVMDKYSEFWKNQVPKSIPNPNLSEEVFVSLGAFKASKWKKFCIHTLCSFTYIVKADEDVLSVDSRTTMSWQLGHKISTDTFSLPSYSRKKKGISRESNYIVRHSKIKVRITLACFEMWQTRR